MLTRLAALERGERTFEDIASPPMTLGVGTSVSDAFDRFQAQDQELALVLEDGEVVGLVTATDALEAVMREPEDPLDRAYGYSPTRRTSSTDSTTSSSTRHR